MSDAFERAEEDVNEGRGEIFCINGARNKKKEEECGLVFLRKSNKSNLYYQCWNQNNYRNKIFKLLYNKKMEVFSYLNGGGINAEFCDQYIAKYFCQWEKDYENNSGSNVEDGEKTYECLVLNEISAGWNSWGWIRDLPLMSIYIDRPGKDDKNIPYLLKENEILSTKLFKSDDKYEFTRKAKCWSNENIIVHNYEELPTYLDGDDFLRKYDHYKVGVVHEGFLKKKNQSSIKFKKIVDKLVKKDGGWGWGVGDKNLLNSHNYLLKSADYEKLMIIFDQNLISVDEDIFVESLEEYYFQIFTKERIKMLLASIYRIASKNIDNELVNKERWTIISDERINNNYVCIMYSIIPPGVSGIVATTTFYHGTEDIYSKETKELQKRICSDNRVLNFSFKINRRSFSQMGITSPQKMTAMSISNTFPIITEILINKDNSKKKLKISFINEQIDDGDYRAYSDIVLETMDSIVAHYKANRNVVIGKISSPWGALPKNPNSHPYMQYPDLIGRKYDLEKYNFNFDEYIESINEFEGSITTFNEIKNILLSKMDPLKFFETLIKSDNKELANYCVDSDSEYHYQQILRKRIRENIDILEKEKSLDALFEIIRKNSERVIAQKMIRNILSEIFVNWKKGDELTEILPEYKLSPRQEFEWLMQRLDYENKRGNVDMITELKKILIKRRESGELRNIEEGRMRNMENLFIICDQSMFIFDNFDASEIKNIIDAEHSTKEDDAAVGSMALSILLKCKDSNESDFKLAEEGEKYLLGKVASNKYDKTRIRRFVNRIEIKIVKNLTKNSMNKEAIDKNLLQEIRDCHEAYSEYYSKSEYFMAAILKTIALTDFENDDDLKDFAEKILEAHCFIRYDLRWPNNRVAYWFIRAYFNLNPDKIYAGSEGEDTIDSRIGRCSELLFKIKNKEKNVVGLITMCELLDLYYRFRTEDGWHPLERFSMISEDTLIQSYEKMLESALTSRASREWFEENRPGGEDWLKPLNFNYR